MNETVVLFPGVDEVFEDTETVPDLDAIIATQNDLLLRWRIFGEELRRQAEQPLAFGLAQELRDLIDESSM